MRPVDAAPTDLETVRRILREHAPELEVRAFGSRVSWTARETSDLDLALMTDEPLDAARMAVLRAAFTDSRLPFRVDVVDWAGVSDGFRKVIESEYVTLVGKPGRGTGGSWPTAPLGQVTELTLSSVDKKTKPHEQAVLLCNYMDVYSNKFIRSDLDFMTATATEREIRRCALRPGDVVITKDSEQYDDIGVPALVRDDVGNLVCGYHLAILRPLQESIHGHYLLYALQIENVQHQFHAYANGVTRFGLRKDDILRVEIPLPPLPEQRAIAGVLGALDDRIDLNRRMSETLEAMARALFKSWFVDFDPVRAKAEGRDTGLPDHIADLFPDRLVDSELGEIPEGWKVKSLDEIADFMNGLALQKFPPEDDQWLPIIKISEMRRGYTPATGKASPDIHPKYIIDDGDLLFSWSGSLRIVLWAHGPGALNQHLFKVTSKNFPKWLYWGWLHRHLDNFRMIADGKATTMGHIQRHHLSGARVVIPSMDLLAKGNDTLGSVLERYVTSLVMNRMLNRLRDTLLPKLVSGEVRLGEAVERLESAT